MTNASIPQQNEKKKLFNQLLEAMKNAYAEETEKLVYLCYEKNIPQEEIAEKLDMTKQALSKKYPKEKKHE